MSASEERQRKTEAWIRQLEDAGLYPALTRHLRELSDRLEAAKRERDEYRDHAEALEDGMQHLRHWREADKSALADMKKALDYARGALDFYADPMNYDEEGRVWADTGGVPDTDETLDRGKVAQYALDSLAASGEPDTQEPQP